MIINGMIANGENPQIILKQKTTIVEGAFSAHTIKTLAQEFNIDMPICTLISDIISENITVDRAISSLLSRPLTQEH